MEKMYGVFIKHDLRNNISWFLFNARKLTHAQKIDAEVCNREKKGTIILWVACLFLTVCFLSLPLLFCVVWQARDASSEGDTEGAKRMGYIALGLNIAAVASYIVLWLILVISISVSATGGSSSSSSTYYTYTYCYYSYTYYSYYCYKWSGCCSFSAVQKLSVYCTSHLIKCVPLKHVPPAATFIRTFEYVTSFVH